MARARRARSSGSISTRPRKDGRWEARLVLPDGRRKSFYGTTWAEAEAKLNKARATIAVGTFAEPGKATVADVAHDYIELNPDNLRRRSLGTRVSLLNLHVLPVVGRVKLSAFTVAHGNQVIATARKAGYAESTLLGLHSALRAVLRYAMDAGLLGANPMDRVRAPKAGDPRDLPFISLADIDNLMKAIATSELRMPYTLGVGLGLRWGEARGLRWRDIDFDRGVARIRYQVENVGGEVRFVELKTKSSRRDLPLPGFVVETLKAERRKQAERRLRLGPDWHDYDLVCTHTGWPLNGTTLLDQLTKLCSAAGVPRLTFHQLRHLCATILMSRGVPPRVVQAILGHVSPATAMRVYQHVMNTDLAAALGSLHEALGGEDVAT